MKKRKKKIVIEDQDLNLPQKKQKLNIKDQDPNPKMK